MLQIAKGETPKIHSLRLFEYQGGKRVLISQQEIDFDTQDVEIEVITDKKQVRNENKIK